MADELTADKLQNHQRIRLQIIAILILAIVVYSLMDTATQTEVSPDEIISGFREQQYDYYMTDIDSVHFAASGIADYQIMATRLTHYPDPEFSAIENPEFILYQQDANPWYISSRNGRITSDALSNEDKLELMDDVVINREDEAGQLLTIYTDFLTIFPATNQMSTEEEVRMVYADGNHYGMGMFFDLEQDQLEFLSDVESTYETK